MWSCEPASPPPIPALLPVGTVVRVDMPNSRYSGIWTVMDTGPAVQGRLIDLYLWSCHEALAFGRRPVRLTVLRLGWSPQMSAPEPDRPGVPAARNAPPTCRAHLVPTQMDPLPK